MGGPFLTSAARGAQGTRSTTFPSKTSLRLPGRASATQLGGINDAGTAIGIWEDVQADPISRSGEHVSNFNQRYGCGGRLVRRWHYDAGFTLWEKVYRTVRFSELEEGLTRLHTLNPGSWDLVAFCWMTGCQTLSAKGWPAEHFRSSLG